MNRWPDPIFLKADFLRRSWPVGFSMALSRCSAFNPSQLDESTGTYWDIFTPKTSKQRKLRAWVAKKKRKSHVAPTSAIMKCATWCAWMLRIDAGAKSHSFCSAEKKTWRMNPTNRITRSFSTRSWDWKTCSLLVGYSYLSTCWSTITIPLVPIILDATTQSVKVEDYVFDLARWRRTSQRL